MGRLFSIPVIYRSNLVSKIKNKRRTEDARRKDFAPSLIDLGVLRFKIARHFGFCFGVENAIEIAYRALEENSGRRVFLLSEMIHNPHVNSDLMARGVRFLLSTDGKELVSFSELCPDDVVIVPAFGTTVELFQKLRDIGINPQLYNTTCPFVEKVWKRAADLGNKGFTIVIHGKHLHEETKATFSHARLAGPSLIIRDMEEAKVLAGFIRGENSSSEFKAHFSGRYSAGFDAAENLQRIGVVNQTTMLATETAAITSLLREAMRARVGSDNLSAHFADTRDTLCYATWDNQEAVNALIASGGDLALVVGGYNSSNTSHLVELCEKEIPTYYIKDAGEIIDETSIRHLHLPAGNIETSKNWLPGNKDKLDVLITAGASCPDILVDEVMSRVASFFSLQLH